MKKIYKIVLIIFLIIIGFVFIDTLQALLFNNNPIIGFQTKCMSKRGIFVETFHCEKGNITKIKNNSCNFDDVCNYKAKMMEKKIEDNIENILKTNDGTSSSTYDYINNEYYDNIVHMGMDAVPILERKYENGPYGLESFIAAFIIEDITKCDVKEKYNLEWSNPEEFYKIWKEHNCSYHTN